jgi:hypothetical protein
MAGLLYEWYALARLVEALHYKPEFHGSIPGGVICTMTQCLTEISTTETYGGGGEKWPVLRADNLVTFMCRKSRNSGYLKPLEH